VALRSCISFWLDEAGKSFGNVAAADPDCAMAHWGMAMVDFNQVNSGPTDTGIVAARRKRPSFTTERTGSGCNLAITTNIQDGNSQLLESTSSASQTPSRQPSDNRVSRSNRIRIL
jgi:hypothetical protein